MFDHFIDTKQKNNQKMPNRLFWKLLKSTFMKIVEEKLAFYTEIPTRTSPEAYYLGRPGTNFDKVAAISDKIVANRN